MVKTKNKEIRVAKVGGTSVWEPESIRNIISSGSDFLVVSGPGKKTGITEYKVTDLLLNLASRKLNQELGLPWDYDGLDAPAKKHVRYKHEKIAWSHKELLELIEHVYVKDMTLWGLDPKKVLPNMRLLRSMIKVGSPYTVDAIAIQGEFWQAKIISEALKLPLINPINIRLDRQGGLQKEATYQKLGAESSGVMPGFCGFRERDDGGLEVMLFDRGGTDKSSAILAAALKSQGKNVTRLENWKDVPGIYVCDPRLFNNEEQKDLIKIKNATYFELADLSTNGLDAFNVHAIPIVAEANIPIWIMSTINPSSGVTIVNDSLPDNTPIVRGIEGKKGYQLFGCRIEGAYETRGVGRKIQEILEKYGVSYLLQSGASNNISYVVDTASLRRHKKQVFAEIRDKVHSKDMREIENIGVLSIIGQNINESEALSITMEVLKKNNVQVYVYAADSLSPSFALAIPEEKIDIMKKTLYHAFVENGYFK